MALNLSTLTSPATSGDVLAEALTTADFLEGVPVLRNLSRGSNKGGDAEQSVALNQPKALPLDANGKGYLYLSGVSGNYASVPKDAILNGITSFVMEAKNVYMGDWAIAQEEIFLSNYANGNNAFVFGRNGSVIWLYALYGGNVTQANFAHGLTGAATASVRLTRAGTSVTAELDTGSGYVAIGSSQTVPSIAIDDNSNPLEIGTYNNGVNGKVTGKISQVRIWNNATASGTPVLDVDFTATNVRHGDTKFKCATNQIVTINTAGLDPAKIIKRPVLRFDGVNDGLNGLFANNINGGYMFAAFSVLGAGGVNDGRVFSVNANGAGDIASSGFVYGLKYGGNNDLAAYGAGAYRWAHNDMYDDDRGDILYETKAKSGGLISKVNNANKFQPTTTLAIASNEFNVGNGILGVGRPVAIDLDFLALFPATITDAQADSVREYIRAKTQVYDLPTPIENDYSVAFDGTDDYMSMTLPVLGNTHTLSAWFKTTASYGGAGSEGTLISYISSGGGNDDSVLSVMTNKVGWSDFTDDNQFGTSIVNDGNWHHAVAVVTASTQKIYVDGVLETTTSNAYSAGTSFSSATIGRRANAAQRFFNGNIDEIAIWDSALTANEVKSIYNDGKPVDLSGQPELYSSANNLVAWWRMGDNNGGTGTAVTDNSANSYNGSLVNGPTFQTNTP